MKAGSKPLLDLTAGFYLCAEEKILVPSKEILNSFTVLFTASGEKRICG